MDEIDTPGDAHVTDGIVVLEGPGSLAVTMTPEAAKVTAERLLSAAVEALAAREAGERP